MSDAWYASGLRFRCRRCGACCTGEPGYVYLRRGEAEAAARHLGLGVVDFRERYERREGGKASLREKEDGRCIFYGKEGCRIYRVRPLQCRTFPFWRQIVGKRALWEKAAAACPGIGSGRLFTSGEIRMRLRGRMR